MQNPLQSNGADGLASLQFINVTDNIMSDPLEETQASFLPAKHEAKKRRRLEAGIHVHDDSDSDDGQELLSASQQNAPGPQDGPKPGKKTKGRVKIKMEFIENKLRRYTTFSKRKTGIMKKAYELSTLTGTQVMLLVASETGHVYTFATRKLQPMITSESGKALIQTCLNSPDQPPPGSHNDQRMNPLGFEETELNYAISEDEAAVQKQQAAASMQYLRGPLPASSPESSSPSLQLPTTPQPAASPSQLTAAPMVQPTRTIAMTSYLTSQAVPVSASSSTSAATTTSSSSSGATMQLPTVPSAVSGGIAAILPPAAAGLPAGTVTLSSLTGQSHVAGQTPTLYRIPANMAAGQVLSQVSIPGATTTASTATGPGSTTAVSADKIENYQSFLSGALSQSTQRQQQQQQQTASTSTVPQPLAVVNSSSTAGGVASQGTVVYQTAQGLVYATPSTAVSGLPEGYILNLPQTPGLPAESQHTGGTTPQFITIPMQQVLQPILTPANPDDQQRAAQSNVRK